MVTLLLLLPSSTGDDGDDGSRDDAEGSGDLEEPP